MQNVGYGNRLCCPATSPSKAHDTGMNPTLINPDSASIRAVWRLAKAKPSSTDSKLINKPWQHFVSSYVDIPLQCYEIQELLGDSYLFIFFTANEYILVRKETSTVHSRPHLYVWLAFGVIRGHSEISTFNDSRLVYCIIILSCFYSWSLFEHRTWGR